MKRQFSNLFKIFSSVCLFVPTFIFVTVSITSCTSQNTIQFANFESYMSPDLIDRLHDRYDVQFTYFNTNEDIQKKFEKYYDIAVPSAYEMADLAQKGMLAKIDWAKFNIKNFPNPNFPLEDGAPEKIDINNATDALNLFGPNIDDYNEGTLRNLLLKKHDLNNDGDPENLLEYAIPYFAQDLLFAYKGNENNIIQSKTKWSDLAYEISPSNPNVDQRFKKNGAISKIGLIDDSRTIYDVSRIVQTENAGEKTTIYPQNNATQKEMQETYQSFCNLYQSVSDWFYLNTDSGWMSRTFADPSGINGVIAYTGDIIYSAQGAGEFDKYTPDDFHIVHPDLTQENLDLLVINKNITGTEKEQQIYDLVYDTALDGCAADTFLTKDNSDTWIGAKNDDGEYKYGTMLNYDSVGYTPTLTSVKKFIIENNGPEAVEYWNIDPTFDAETKMKWLNFYHNIMEVHYDLDFFDQPLTSFQKSEMHWAYIKERAKL